MPRKNFTKESLTKLTDDMIASLTSEEMVGRMRKFKSGSSESPETFLTVDSVKDAGGYLPAKMRLTSRYFEDTIATGATYKKGVPAMDTIITIDPDFANRIKTNYPDSYARLVSVDFDGFEDNDIVAASACGGAGGTVGGTGGCACGGAQDDDDDA